MPENNGNKTYSLAHARRDGHIDRSPMQGPLAGKNFYMRLAREFVGKTECDTEMSFNGKDRTVPKQPALGLRTPIGKMPNRKKNSLAHVHPGVHIHQLDVLDRSSILQIIWVLPVSIISKPCRRA